MKPSKSKKIVVLPAVGFIAILLMAAFALQAAPAEAPLNPKLGQAPIIYPNPGDIAEHPVLLTVPNTTFTYDALAPSQCRPAAACRDGEEYPILAAGFEIDGGYLGNGNDQLALAPGRPDGGYLGNSA